jgi:hypothetical protein
MPCHPAMCLRAADCADKNCPGHPEGAEAYLDEQDRTAVHEAAMKHPVERGIYLPLLQNPKRRWVPAWLARLFSLKGSP